MNQYLFKFTKHEDLSPLNYFVSAANEEAYRWIQKWPGWPGRCLIVCGPAASGKTHLATVWQHASGAQFFDHRNGLLQTLNGKKRHYIIENIETLENQQSLLHAYNHARESGTSLLMTSRVPVKQLHITLPDLRSRLHGSVSVEIVPPDDTLLRLVLAKQFADRQLRVPVEVLNYLATHMERSFAAAHRIVEHIDTLSIEQKRNITVPFIRTILVNSAPDGASG